MTIRSKLYSLATVVVFALAIAACGSDDSNPSDGGGTDTTPPTVSNVAATDESHVDVTFSEAVTKTSAEDTGHYLISAVPLPAAPSKAAGGGQSIVAASLHADNKTVTLTTGIPLGTTNYTLSVHGVADTHGNSITTTVDKPFTGSDNPDVTAPTIVSRSPAPSATNVPVGQVVLVQFSEFIDYTSFQNGLAWTDDNSAAVPNQVQSEDGVNFSITPTQPLTMGTLYHISLSNVQDPTGNIMPVTNWSFTTTSVADHTPPTLVSTVPANLATNVDVNTNLSLTFSEPVNQVEFNVTLIPEPGDGVDTWSNGGKTITFDPDLPLLDNQTYVFTIYPHGVSDLSGNGFVGLKTVVFTTGSALAGGSIAGTITGDPGSEAADPTGATVIAATGNPFTGAGAFDIVGSAIVAANNTYTMSYLSDGYYFPLSIMDTSGDGNLDPSGGDAIGAYGVNLALGDQDPDSVVIAGGNHATGVNFPMIDPSAITGMVTYSGSYAGGSHPIFVGLFDVNGFDPSNDPDVGQESSWPLHPEWGFNTLDQQLADGDYYVGAFIDVNFNFTYEPAVDPAGFYGGLPAPTALHIANGSDIAGIVIAVEDPLTVNSTASVAWPAAKHSATFQRLCDVVRQSQKLATK